MINLLRVVTKGGAEVYINEDKVESLFYNTHADKRDGCCSIALTTKEDLLTTTSSIEELVKSLTK